MKGHTVIELTDVYTGEVKRYEKDNMVTNALRDIVNRYPKWLEGALDNTTSSITKLTPLRNEFLGGILIFNEELNSDPADYYHAGGIVGYANEEANTSDDLMRGSFNAGESEFTNNSCKWVWDFTTNQANGTIRSLGLTHRQAGKVGFGNKNGLPLLVRQQRDVCPKRINSNFLYYRANWIDFENRYFGSIVYRGTKSFTLAKTRIWTDCVKLAEDIIEEAPFETISITPATFGSNNSIAFCGDGEYMWGFSYPQNASGNATVNWIKINKATGEYTEGTWVLEGVKLMAAGTAMANRSDYQPKCEVRNGYLYAAAYNAVGLYKIKLTNPTDITFLERTINNTWSGSSGMINIRGVIYGTDFILDENDNFQEKNASNTYYNSPCYYNYARMKDSLGPWRYEGIRGSIDNTVSLTLDAFYLATKNNLSQPITKTAAQTMKITYTLSESSEI